MLPKNPQQKKVMDSMLKDYSFKKHFLSDTKKQGLMDLMVKHNITKDLRNMKDYEKKGFLKDVEKSRLDYYGKKALHEHYGMKRNEESKAQQPKQSSYNEIMAKKKIEQQKVAQFNLQPRKNSVWNMLGFRSNDNLGKARDLVKRADNYGEKNHAHADNYDETREMINRIQS